VTVATFLDPLEDAIAVLPRLVEEEEEKAAMAEESSSTTKAKCGAGLLDLSLLVVMMMMWASLFPFPCSFWGTTDQPYLFVC